MTNDSKLGMFAGVLGVLVAAVFFAKHPEAKPVAAEPQAKLSPGPQATLPASLAPSLASKPAETIPASLPTSAIARTRPDVDAQPASRQPGLEEEP